MSQANTFISIEGSPTRYAKGQKPREVSMNGILGQLKQDTVIHPFKPLVDKQTERTAKIKEARITEISETNKTLRSV